MFMLDHSLNYFEQIHFSKLQKHKADSLIFERFIKFIDKKNKSHDSPYFDMSETHMFAF